MTNIETISEAWELLKEGDNLKPVPQDYIVYDELIKGDKKRLNLTDEDIEELKKEIKRLPPNGQYDKHIFKFRWSPKRWNMGKRGALRVIYVTFVVLKEVHLVQMYKKNEQEDITKEELEEIKKLAREYERR